MPPYPSVRKSNASESTPIVSARKPVRPTAMGPLGDDLVLVAKGRFRAFVDDARLFGRDWGLRLADVKASVLADQRMRRLPARCLAQVGSMQLQARQALPLPHAISTRARAQARRQGRRRDLSPAGTMFVKYGRDNVTRVRPIQHT